MNPYPYSQIRIPFPIIIPVSIPTTNQTPPNSLSSSHWFSLFSARISSTIIRRGLGNFNRNRNPNAMSFVGSKFFRGTVLGPAEYLTQHQNRWRLMNKEEMERYDKKVTQTKGFDVDGCTGCMPGRIVPIGPTCYEFGVAEELAEFAVESQSKYKEKCLEVVSLDKANRQGTMGCLYYLTFTAKDKNIVDVGKEQNIKTYRAKVWRKPDDDLVLEYFAEFKPPQKKAGKQEAVTPHKAKIGGKSSNRSKKLSKGKQGPAAGSGRGRLLAGFHAVRKELKEKNPSWTHSQAMGAASKLWKSMSSAKKESYVAGIGTSFKQA